MVRSGAAEPRTDLDKEKASSFSEEKEPTRLYFWFSFTWMPSRVTRLHLEETKVFLHLFFRKRRILNTIRIDPWRGCCGRDVSTRAGLIG
jgi:hypothetical protein